MKNDHKQTVHNYLPIIIILFLHIFMLHLRIQFLKVSFFTILHFTFITFYFNIFNSIKSSDSQRNVLFNQKQRLKVEILLLIEKANKNI